MSDRAADVRAGGRDQDAAFPGHHVRPRTGWVNDPNGPILWKGRYHLFFQHNPGAPVHRAICWGHVSTADLVHWTAEPFALVPQPDGPDAAGCWSGCTIDGNGVVTAVYTGAAGGPQTAVICLAYAHDDQLRGWHQDPVPVAAPPADLVVVGFRDPFVFARDGRRYAAVGAGETPGGRAAILLYACDDIRQWTFLGSLLDTTDAVAARFAAADVWECPQLVRMSGRWVLVVSLMGSQLGRVAYLVGDLLTTDRGLRFVATSGGLVDHGHDFYAAAVLVADAGVLMWGWTWEDRPGDVVSQAGWAGALTMTRELTLSPSGELLNSPVAETALLHHTQSLLTLAPGRSITLPDGPPWLSTSMPRTTAGSSSSSSR